MDRSTFCCFYFTCPCLSTNLSSWKPLYYIKQEVLEFIFLSLLLQTSIKKRANINITQEIFKNQLSNATNEYLQQESQLSNVFQFTFSFTPHGLKLQVYFICLVHAGMGPEPRIHAWSGKHPNN